MELNQIMSLLTHNTCFDEKNYNVNNDNLGKFKTYLINAGYSEEDIAAEDIRRDIENRLQKISFGSSKVKLIVSPQVYKNMVKYPNVKKKMDAIFNDFLSENGELSWMVKEARAGGGEISLTIDNDGNTVYTGKLYGIPGWDDKEESFDSSKDVEKRLLPLLEEKKSLVNQNLFSNIPYLDCVNILNNNSINMNQLILGSPMLRQHYLKKLTTR